MSEMRKKKIYMNILKILMMINKQEQNINLFFRNNYIFLEQQFYIKHY